MSLSVERAAVPLSENTELEKSAFPVERLEPLAIVTFEFWMVSVELEKVMELFR